MKSVTLLLVPLLVIGCSTVDRVKPTASDEAASKGYVLGEPVEGIYDYDINGWQYVSRNSLIIPSRPSQRYLLMFDQPCHELSSTEVIATTSTASRLRAGFDSIIPRAVHGIPQKCRVSEIYRINKEKPPEE